jgi:hypothetical protein
VVAQSSGLFFEKSNDLSLVWYAWIKIEIEALSVSILVEIGNKLLF